MKSSTIKNDPKCKRVGFRITEDAYNLYIKQYANAEIQSTKKKYSASDFFRDALFEREQKIIQINKRSTPKPRKCEQQKLRMLVNTTNNLNQIALALNIMLKSSSGDINIYLHQLNDIHKFIVEELS